MAEQELANERIQIICEKIRSETLDPAKDQARSIIESAKKEADLIRQQARSDGEKILKDAHKQMEEEKQIFQSSLHQAAKQTIELLKQKIERALFDPALEKWVIAELGNEQAHARLIDVLVKAIEQEGIHTDFAVQIPQHFSADSINAHLSREILNRLKNNSVELTDIEGGVKVKLINQHLTLDISDKTLEEILLTFVHKSFRKVFFHTGG